MNGIIVIYDFLLGFFIDLFFKDIYNYCFEVDIINNELIFFYKFRDGIV